MTITSTILIRQHTGLHIDLNMDLYDELHNKENNDMQKDMHSNNELHTNVLYNGQLY